MEKVNNERQEPDKEGMADLGDRKGGRLETGEGHTHIQHCITDRDHGYTSYRQLHCTINYDSKKVKAWSTKMFFVINFYEN